MEGFGEVRDDGGGGVCVRVAVAPGVVEYVSLVLVELIVIT